MAAALLPWAAPLSALLAVVAPNGRSPGFDRGPKAGQDTEERWPATADSKLQGNNMQSSCKVKKAVLSAELRAKDVIHRIVAATRMALMALRENEMSGATGPIRGRRFEEPIVDGGRAG